jgi:hypothetical protein
MILKKCPDCEKDISANALNCVYCGRSINSLEDFRMRFKSLMEDIKYTKDRQWTITYYLLLLYSGLIALGFKIPCSYHRLRIFLGLLGLCIFIFGFWYLFDLFKAIKVYRTYLFDDVLPKLTINEIERKTIIARSKCKNEKAIEDHKNGKDSIKWMVCFILILLFAFVLQLLFLKDFIPIIRNIFSWAFYC